MVPKSRLSEQSPGQLMPAGSLVTLPLPEPFKKTFKYGFAKAKILLPSFLFIVFLIFIILWLFYYTTMMHILLPLFVIFLLLIPTVTWSRIYYLGVVEKIDVGEKIEVSHRAKKKEKRVKKIIIMKKRRKQSNKNKEK